MFSKFTAVLAFVTIVVANPIPQLPTSLPLPISLPGLPTSLPVSIPDLPTSLPISIPDLPTSLPVSLPISLPISLPLAVPTDLPGAVRYDGVYPLQTFNDLSNHFL